jgi:hypothetical protein
VGPWSALVLGRPDRSWSPHGVLETGGWGGRKQGATSGAFLLGCMDNSGPASRACKLWEAGLVLLGGLGFLQPAALSLGGVP